MGQVWDGKVVKNVKWAGSTIKVATQIGTFARAALVCSSNTSDHRSSEILVLRDQHCVSQISQLLLGQMLTFRDETLLHESKSRRGTLCMLITSIEIRAPESPSFAGGFQQKGDDSVNCTA